ncbi:hypothetical protein JCM15519_11470 [Fundidesulfovibrio butyratiphilus]
MSYYSLLGLVRDPFVTTPDPDLFFHCPRQMDHLDRLEIAVRLRRGLNVVLGPVGTGKSTLSRQLMRALGDNPEFDTHLLLDPYFESEKEFLLWLNHEFDIPEELVTDSAWRLKDNLKNKLYETGVEQGRIVCLIVDEGQKITPTCLEILRELLNYETNDSKLLQIVLFAQEEFEEHLRLMHNLADRVYQTLRLGNFNFTETKDLIRTRLELCKGEGTLRPLFTPPAFLAVYLATKGYPRQVIQLCHKAMLAAIANSRQKADWGMVWACTDAGRSPLARHGIDLLLLSLMGVAAGYALFTMPELLDTLLRLLGLNALLSPHG